MKITEITLQNFKPFYGEVTINPTTDSGKPILLMRGKNDAGKTSFHSAFRFCLYGPEDTEEKHSLINRTAASEADGKAGVIMSFEHGEEIFTVERMVEFSQVNSADDRQADNIYRQVRDASGKIVVGKSAGTQEYQMFMNRVLPENVADFFFFDAEELNRFEQSHDEEVREAIETVLGIQEIENAISDLGSKKEDYEREFTSIKSTIEENQERKEKLEGVQERIDEITGEGGGLEEVDSELETKRSSLESVKQEISDLSDTADKRQQLEEIDEEIGELEDSLKESKEDRNELQRRAGPMIAQNAATVILEDYDVEGVNGEAEVISSILTGNRSTCLCGEELTQEHRNHLRERWNRLSSEETRRLSNLQGLCGNLDINIDAELEKYQNVDQNVRRLEVKIEELEVKKEGIESDVREIEEDAEERLKQRRDELRRDIEDLDDRRAEVNQELGELESKKDQLLSRIQSQGGATEREERFQELISLAGRSQEAMEDIKNELIDQRREEVEEHASETFLKLTNRPDQYDGLTITDNYELRVRSGGASRTIQEQKPSEGQKQIIAYSFIAGLSRYTTRDAPVVIDTPIGRLDREHKNNLLKHYPEFSEQVMILYQPNELELEDQEQLSDSMSKHYSIEVRDDVEDASTIAELPELVMDPNTGGS